MGRLSIGSRDNMQALPAQNGAKTALGRGVEVPGKGQAVFVGWIAVSYKNRIF